MKELQAAVEEKGCLGGVGDTRLSGQDLATMQSMQTSPNLARFSQPGPMLDEYRVPNIPGENTRWAIL